MSAVHRVDDIWSMEASRFFRFARRLPAYQGAMRSIAEREAVQDHKRKEAQGLAGKEIVPVPAGELSRIPGLEGAVEIG